MISLDTNLILAALDPKDIRHEDALSFLEATSSNLCVSLPVYAELRAGEGWPAVEAFLKGLHV